MSFIANGVDASAEILIVVLVSFLLGYVLRALLESLEERQSNPVVVAAKPTINVDDLKIVEGIGPKIEELLKNAGIKNLNMLSKTATEKLETILAEAGDRFRIHSPTTWPKQAAMAAKGEMNKLHKYQDSLNTRVPA